MNHVQDRLSDYLLDDMERKERAEVESHLRECTVCREEYDSLLRLWAKLGTMSEEKPSEAVRTRFYSMLEAYQEGLRHASAPEGVASVFNRMLERFWPARPAIQFGIAVLFLVAGILAGSRLNDAPDQQVELTQLRGEVRHMGQLLTISLLSQQSASERLRGVAWSHQMDHPDAQVIQALIRALKYDRNVNVRLAAVDALEKFASDPDVRQEVLKTLPRESSPLVQIALIDLLIEEQVPQSAQVLEQMASDPSVDKSVKQRIAAGIKELSL